MKNNSEKLPKYVLSLYKTIGCEVKKILFGHNGYNRKSFTNLRLFCTVFGLSTIISQASGASLKPPSSSHSHIENAIIITQLPVDNSISHQSAGTTIKQQKSLANWPLRVNLGEGARLVKVKPDFSIEILSRGFYSACDPEISFDASRILFAGKKTHTNDWNIFEMGIDGSNIRQVTNGEIPSRSPGYQSTLYTIVSPKPWKQITYVGSENGFLNLYSCKLDGSEVRRLTYNLSCNTDPFLMPDGRLLFSSSQQSSLYRGITGNISLFGISIDGTDYTAFCTDEGKRIKHMPCTTTKGLAVFIESDRLLWDGSGSVGSVRIRRPLHSYRQITRESDGLFHSPSPLPDGKVLISRRSPNGRDTHGIYKLEPSTGQLELIFDSPDYHDIQAKIIYPSPEPDGRSSVVTEKDPYGKLYCLDVKISDLDKPEWMSPGIVKRLRVLEGISSTDNITGDHISSGTEANEPSTNRSFPPVQQRILGEIDIAEDGSFNIEIPANTPIKLQTLDVDGMALRSCDWIWARNHEPRGCIGCHEDGELTPENVLVKAVTNPSIKLTLPAKQRRTVDFRRDIIPIIEKKCLQCHNQTSTSFAHTNNLSLVTRTNGKALFHHTYESLLAAEGRTGYRKYVHPASARTSPLIWHIFGRNTSRPWDESFFKQKVTQMPPEDKQALTEDEKRIFVEWIDMGALWDGIPGPDKLPRYHQNSGGGGK
jgi:Tol biopolymer transport system component